MTTTSALTAAKRELALRRRRNEVLGQELFGEPAWDMLLDLFVAHEEDRPLSVGRLCSAAGVPESTARRWLATLESHGTVVRTSDPADACSELVLLTAAERDRLVRFLGEGSG